LAVEEGRLPQSFSIGIKAYGTRFFVLDRMRKLLGLFFLAELAALV